MVFSSNEFLFMFMPAVLFCYYALLKKSRKLQNIFLTFASLGFYAWGEPLFVLVMLGSILANWLLGLLVGRSSGTLKTALAAADVCINIGILFVFKYLSFFANAIAGSEVLSISLPIGISFFTFQAMSYVLDVARGRGLARKNPLDVALYISFFPQLIAGPIVRYETVSEQINGRTETLAGFTEGVERFMVGFIKKSLFANNLAILADLAFDHGVPSVLFAWLGIFAYSLQIYFDFSGYSDMAIGLGKMFGFHFLENFDHPYAARSITEFWKRWHISLGQWLRDYVYFPLGGSRVSKGRLVFNLFVVWLVTGAWHGANWTFFLWGLWFFVLITLEKLTGFAKRLGVFGHAYAMLFVMLGWVLFRSPDLPSALAYVKSMLGLAGSGLATAADLFWLRNHAFFLAAGILFSVPVFKKVPRIAQVAGIAFAYVIALSYMIKGTYNPFVYFNF
ncbi:MAG: MBOAT family protein [Clostridiales bacterium]|jgi:alginate O-acetyltransferase complex protein AlgI|nr:MBOAT family protein [Clostridiales bacterium]